MRARFETKTFRILRIHEENSRVPGGSFFRRGFFYP